MSTVKYTPALSQNEEIICRQIIHAQQGGASALLARTNQIVHELKYIVDRFLFVASALSIQQVGNTSSLHTGNSSTSASANFLDPNNIPGHGFLAGGSINPYNHARKQNNRPIIKLPGFQTSSGSSQLPPIKTNSLPASLSQGLGYTANHLQYSLVRAKAASYAYAQNTTHAVVVQVRLVRMPVGKTKNVLVGVRLLLLVT
jgi:hypothetical protein